MQSANLSWDKPLSLHHPRCQEFFHLFITYKIIPKILSNTFRTFHHLPPAPFNLIELLSTCPLRRHKITSILYMSLHQLLPLLGMLSPTCLASKLLFIQHDLHCEHLLCFLSSFTCSSPTHISTGHLSHAMALSHYLLTYLSWIRSQSPWEKSLSYFGTHLKNTGFP